MLTDAEVATLNGEIAIAKVNLGTTRTAINDYRTHKSQHDAAMAAVTKAQTAASELSETSSADDVTAAEEAILAAKDAVAAGTMLTDAEKATLNTNIGTAETALSTAKTAIAAKKKLDDAEKVAELYGEASGATADAIAARKAAEQAKEDAKKYADMLGTGTAIVATTAVLHSGGDSGMATANAQKVLDAGQAATQAVLDATAAKDRATAAKTEATALADDTTGKTALIGALDTAIESAKGEIKTATGIRDDKTAGSVYASVRVVTGADTDDPNTASDAGKIVATQLNAALANGTRVTQHSAFSDAPTITEPSTTQSVAVTYDDGVGMTWTEIASNLMDKTIIGRDSNRGLNNTLRQVKAKSAAGMKTTDFWLSANVPATIDTDGEEVTGGTQFDSSTPANDPTYKGIAGELFCAGSSTTKCKVEGWRHAHRKLVLHGRRRHAVLC